MKRLFSPWRPDEAAHPPRLPSGPSRSIFAFLLSFFALLPACATASAQTPSPAPPPPPSLPLPPPQQVALQPAPNEVIDPSLLPGDEDAIDEEAFDEEEGVDDEEVASVEPPPPPKAKVVSPLLSLSDAEIRDRFKKDPASFGPLSVGKPNAGALVNGVRMPSDPAKWTVREPGLAYGTQETVDGIAKAIELVHQQFPGADPIPIGHISSKNGGYLPVHKSHQAGRDVDIGYYYTKPQKFFVSGNKKNLDLPKTYALVKAFFTVSDIEMIFIDTSIQKLLVEYALSKGESTDWLDKTFQSRQKPGFAPVRHVRGHRDHLHVRFSSPQAVALGQRVSGLVAIRSAPPPGRGGKGAVAHAAAPPGGKIIRHKAKSGNTLDILARHYGTTVDAIQKANGLKGTALKAGRVYLIPVPPPPKRGAPLPHK